MPDTETPNVQADQSADAAQQPQTQDGNTQPQSVDTRQFSPEQQEVVNGIVQERLARESKKIREQERKAYEAELAEQKRQADLSEQERVKEQQAQLEQQRAELEQERLQFARSRSLAGKVVDVNKALRLVEDKHIQDDGTLDVAAFLADNPFLQATTTPTRQPTTAANVASNRLVSAADARKDKMNALLRGKR